MRCAGRSLLSLGVPTAVLTFPRADRGASDTASPWLEEPGLRRRGGGAES